MWLARSVQTLAKLVIPSMGLGPLDQEWTFREVCALLVAYYEANGVYLRIDENATYAGELSMAVRELEDPVPAVIEYYAAVVPKRLTSEALPIVTKNEDLLDPIKRIWKWSNLDQQAIVSVRDMALYGTAFFRVVSDNDTKDSDLWIDSSNVRIRRIPPKCVTEFHVDGEGHVTYLRYDAQITVTNEDGNAEAKWYTEVWDVPHGRRVWSEHGKGSTCPVANLDTPTAEDTLDELDLPFIPWAYAPFRLAGDEPTEGPYGMPAIWTALTLIDDMCAGRTRLNQMLFRHKKADLAVTKSDTDKSGRPTQLDAASMASANVNIGGERLWLLPGGTDMKYLIAGIDFGPMLANLEAQSRALDKHLPELNYYTQREGANTSGAALRVRLGPAIDRALEARTNFEAGLIEALKMALYAGNMKGLWEPKIGEYESGRLDFAFAKRPIIEDDATDLAALVNAHTQAGLSPITALRMVQGLTKEQEAEILSETAVWKGMEEIVLQAVATGVIGREGEAQAANASQAEAFVAALQDVLGKVTEAAAAETA